MSLTEIDYAKFWTNIAEARIPLPPASETAANFRTFPWCGQFDHVLTYSIPLDGPTNARWGQWYCEPYNEFVPAIHNFSLSNVAAGTKPVHTTSDDIPLATYTHPCSDIGAFIQANFRSRKAAPVGFFNLYGGQNNSPIGTMEFVKTRLSHVGFADEYGVDQATSRYSEQNGGEIAHGGGAWTGGLVGYEELESVEAFFMGGFMSLEISAPTQSHCIIRAATPKSMLSSNASMKQSWNKHPTSSVNPTTYDTSAWNDVLLDDPTASDFSVNQNYAYFGSTEIQNDPIVLSLGSGNVASRGWISSSYIPQRHGLMHLRGNIGLAGWNTFTYLPAVPSSFYCIASPREFQLPGSNMYSGIWNVNEQGGQQWTNDILSFPPTYQGPWPWPVSTSDYSSCRRMTFRKQRGSFSVMQSLAMGLPLIEMKVWSDLPAGSQTQQLIVRTRGKMFYNVVQWRRGINAEDTSLRKSNNEIAAFNENPPLNIRQVSHACAGVCGASTVSYQDSITAMKRQSPFPDLVLPSSSTFVSPYTGILSNFVLDRKSIDLMYSA